MIRYINIDVPAVQLGWGELLSKEKKVGMSVIDGAAEDHNPSLSNLSSIRVLR